MASSFAPTQRTTRQIEADLGATRDRLAASIEALVDRVHPNRIKQRTVANAKEFARIKAEDAKAAVVTPDGELRRDRVLIIAGALAGLISLIAVLRRIARGKRS